MKTPHHSNESHQLAWRLLLAAAILVALALQAAGSRTAGAAGAPANNPSRADVFAAGPVGGTPCAPSCNIWAKTGTLALPDATSVDIWGFSDTFVGAATVPGPVLVANQGDPLSITLHNVNIPSALSLTISQQSLIPDTVGVTSGNATTYTFAPGALQPGTYLYEAGLTADGPRQVAMGLSGTLIVRPTSCGSGCAYGPSTTFTDEAVVFLSEIDPSFNGAPSTFNLADFNPKYWLINGKAYPNTDPITTAAGNSVLLRYVNGGIVNHSMSLLGLHQSVVAVDGKPKTNPIAVVANTIPTGSTLDAIATVPASAPTGTKYALFNGAMHLDNKGIRTGPGAGAQIAFGGMLTFLTVGTGSGSTPGGPVTSAAAVTPSPTNGTVAASLSGTVTAGAGLNVTAAEYFVDTLGANGTGASMGGGFGGPSASVSATITTGQLAALTSANHTFYVHGQDSNGQWGPAAAAVLVLDKTGPAISSKVLTPSRTNGTVDVQIQATASDAGTGSQAVTAAEYFIDGAPVAGSGTPFTMPTPATDVSVTATIPAATVLALSEGPHTIAIDAQDALGNWGALGTVTLTIDKTGPGAASLGANPNPTNGTFGVQGGTAGAFYERVDATISDPTSGGVNSNIVTAEYFVDATGTDGSGHAMFAVLGTFTSPTAAVYQLLNLYGIAALTQGPHTIYVHGKDAAGNWGSFGTVTLVVDKTGPAVSALGLAPNPSLPTPSVALTATATDPVNGAAPASNVIAAEWFIGNDPGQGLANAATLTGPLSPSRGITATINTSTFAPGSYTVSVRARDAAHNWGPVTTATLTVSAFADGFESGTTAAWSATSGGGNLSVTAAAAQAGSFGLQATIAGGNSGYVQDNTPAIESIYHARFYFNPNSFGASNTNAHTIFLGLSPTSQNVFNVEVRRQGTNNYQVRATVFRTGGSTSTNWFTISTSAFTAIEIDWRSATNASFGFYTGGVLRQTLTGLNTNALKIDTVRLGPQASLSGITNGATMWFDSFVSARNAVIGP